MVFVHGRKPGNPEKNCQSNAINKHPHETANAGNEGEGIRGGSRGLLPSHVFYQKHSIWHTAMFVNIYQSSQAVSCNAGLVINFVFLKYYFFYKLEIINDFVQDH